MIESPRQAIPTFGQVRRDFGLTYFLNAVVAFLFACTGPVAIIISVATAGGLSRADIASWIFGGFALGGAITILFCLVYRQPLSFAWTIPGTVLLGSALDHLSFDEIIGAYLATGVLIAALGVSGWVRRVMDAIPLPVVMAMVAGVFLDFGLGLIRAVEQSFWIAAPMVIAYLIASRARALARVLPPVLAALLVGTGALLAGDTLATNGQSLALWQWPKLYRPVFSWQALAELVLPLAITVLAAQNAQGFAILRAVGHRPPINAMTVACGLGSILFGLVGSVCACVTGPSNAMLASSGELPRQYTAGVVYGVFGILFGLFAASMTGLALMLPAAYIATLGGLAMLPVLQSAFVMAFSKRFAAGALVTFLITVSGVTIWNIGAPFWGLVLGYALSRLLEWGDFQAVGR